MASPSWLFIALFLLSGHTLDLFKLFCKHGRQDQIEDCFCASAGRQQRGPLEVVHSVQGASEARFRLVGKDY